MDNIKRLEETIEDRIERLEEIKQELTKKITSNESGLKNVYSVQLSNCEAVIRELNELLDYVNEAFQ